MCNNINSKLENAFELPWLDTPESSAEEKGLTVDHSDHLNDQSELPDNNYKVIVDDGYFKKTKRGIPIFNWQLRIVDNENFNGMIIIHKNILSSESAKNYFMDDLFCCGIDMNIEDIEKKKSYKELIGLKLLIRVSTNVDGNKVNKIIKKLYNGEHDECISSNPIEYWD